VSCRSFILSFLLIGLCLTAGWSQTGENPFELEGINKPDSAASTNFGQENPFSLDNQTNQDANPFELSAPNRHQGVQGKAVLDRAKEPLHSSSRNFLFLFFSGLLVFLTILLTIYRATMLSFYKAFWNDNILKLLHRQRPTWKSSTLLWYVFFFLNLTIFLSQWLKYLGSDYSLAYLTLQMCMLVTGLILLKHLVIRLIGSLFPVAKECSLYSFTIIVFAINLGLFLVLINLLIAFGPLSIRPGIFYLAAIIVGLHFFYRSLRALLQTSSLWIQNKFHFFLYLCTVEIAPVLVLLKTVMG